MQRKGDRWIQGGLIHEHYSAVDKRYEDLCGGGRASEHPRRLLSVERPQRFRFPFDQSVRLSVEGLIETHTDFSKDTGVKFSIVLL